MSPKTQPPETLEELWARMPDGMRNIGPAEKRAYIRLSRLLVDVHECLYAIDERRDTLNEYWNVLASLPGVH